MGLISFIKCLVGLDDDSDALEPVTPKPVKNINNQVDLGKDIIDDQDMSASEEVNEVCGQKKDATTEKETKDEKAESTAHLSDAYNLIILDESGSMSTVRDETISGCNETLISIRKIGRAHV